MTHDGGHSFQVYFSCGTGDPVVSFKLARRSGELLRQHLGDAATVRHVQRGRHGHTKLEMQEATAFMLGCLGPSEEGGGVAAATAGDSAEPSRPPAAMPTAPTTPLPPLPAAMQRERLLRFDLARHQLCVTAGHFHLVRARNSKEAS